MATVPAYPVQVEGHLAPRLSRWLWLVKWLLVIPHLLVLVFLWLGFVAASVAAFVAILGTGRYPRGLFDFNVGVLRWTWRVLFYSYSALGTDRYPPFTLGPVRDYPATLDIAYPERLSRRLVLVKWWLLALPHYLVVAFFAGGTVVAWRTDAWQTPVLGGLIGLLVLIAAVVLLVRGRYPHSIFDFVLGMNRWILRVAAYAALMTDAYPPFRLDLGETEPGAIAVTDARAAEEAATSAGGWNVGRALLLALGSLVTLAALALAGAGVFALVVDGTQRDADGFVLTPAERFSTPAHAVLSESVDVRLEGPDWVAERLLGTVKLRSESERPVFVGIGPTGDVLRYLDGVDRAVVTEIGRDPEPVLRGHGETPTTQPGQQRFWAASLTGTGQRALTWDPGDGSWTAVAMNADGSRGVDVELAIGAELDGLGWAGAGLVAGGALLLALGGLLVYAAVPKGARR